MIISTQDPWRRRSPANRHRQLQPDELRAVRGERKAYVVSSLRHVGALLMVCAVLVAPHKLAADVSPVQLPGAPAFDAALQQRLRDAASAAVRSAPPRTTHVQADGAPQYINRLVFASSPYLQQHAYNPVNWYPWGEEAFAAAQREHKPVLLSIGYATCHWCHVMEHECF